jgi:hypothetical protein
MTNTSQDTAHDSNKTAGMGGEYNSMNEDSPNGSPYETLTKHDQSETKRDRSPHKSRSSPTT